MKNGFDAIIIGTGQSGPSLASRFSAAGMKVAVVERKRFGGTCVNNGCVPTKALVASAYVAHLARHAADYGVDTGGGVTGDVYICAAAARVYAREHRVSLSDELARLVVHGTLHALGYDHPEGFGRTRSAMWRRQEGYVKALT